MRTVGRSRGLVHRRYKPQSKRWMYQPKHKKKLDLDALWLYIEMMATTAVVVMTFIIVWWNFC